MRTAGSDLVAENEVFAKENNAAGILKRVGP